MIEYAQRKSEFQRNEKLERLLRELATLLAPAENEVVARDAKPALPVIFVVGPPRSATTLCLQWLSTLGCFAYPSNLLSRFYASPYIGARVQQLLTDPAYQYGRELFDLGAGGERFESVLGKTSGALQPNEFWYFWRRFIPNDQPRVLSEEEAGRVDINGFARGFAALERAFGKPFALKGIILQYNLQLIAAHMPNAVFVHTRRALFHNAQSLLQARLRYYGTIDSWYSVQPPGTKFLRSLDPYQQVVGQIYQTNWSLERQLREIGPARSVTLQYEEFCKDPGAAYASITERLAALGCPVRADYQGVSSFECRNTIRLSGQEARKIEQACEDFSLGRLRPE